MLALAPLDISFFALFSKVRVAEVGGADSVPVSEPVTIASGLSAEGSLAPPSVEVFDAGPAIVEDEAIVESEPARPADTAVATAVAFDDPDAEAAALRAEIAQWRAESGRSGSDDAEADDAAAPEDEIIDAPIDSTADAAAG